MYEHDVGRIVDKKVDVSAGIGALSGRVGV